MSSFRFRSIIFALLLLFPLSVAAEQIIFVDFKNAKLLHYYGDNQRPDVYPIVLPRSNVQQEMRLTRPIHGRFMEAIHHPDWIPTERMKQNDATLPDVVPYGHRLHPLGEYKLMIDWVNPVNPRFWDAVRIHGGAREDDLYLDKSSGCIRMRDGDIIRMVTIMQVFGGDIRVIFMPPQFMS